MLLVSLVDAVCVVLLVYLVIMPWLNQVILASPVSLAALL